MVIVSKLYIDRDFSCKTRRLQHWLVLRTMLKQLTSAHGRPSPIRLACLANSCRKGSQEENIRRIEPIVHLIPHSKIGHHGIAQEPSSTSGARAEEAYKSQASPQGRSQARCTAIRRGIERQMDRWRMRGTGRVSETRCVTFQWLL